MVTIIVPTSYVYVGAWFALMVICGLFVWAIAATLEAVDAHRDAAEQRAKVRRQSRESYTSPGAGEYEQARADDTRRPIGGVRHA